MEKRDYLRNLNSNHPVSVSNRCCQQSTLATVLLSKRCSLPSVLFSAIVMSDISNSTSSITVKAHLRDEIRRFSLPLTPFPTFASLSSLIKKIFSDAERGFVMKYRDDEGIFVLHSYLIHSPPIVFVLYRFCLLSSMSSLFHVRFLF